MDDLLRFSGAVQRDPLIEAWFCGLADPFQLMARTWFELMRGCGTDVRELLHDGCPVACVEDAPFGYVNAFKAHANVGFYRGAMLADPAGLLEGQGKRMRHVKLHPGREINTEALSDLIEAAYHDIRQCLTPPGTTTKKATTEKSGLQEGQRDDSSSPVIDASSREFRSEKKPERD